MHDLTVPNEANKPASMDAGIMARERLEIKRFKRTKVLMRVMTFLLITLVVFLAAVGYGVYTELNKPGVRYNDYRECKYEDLENKLELTGKRKYSYLQKEFLGFQYRQGKDTTEQTVINVRGSSMSIVGLSDGGWKSIYVGEGEQGVQILMDADLYVVTVGRKSAVFNYADFCK